MLLIKTTVKPSSIHGLGLFADQDISKGTVVWKFSPRLDIELPPTDFQNLSDYEKSVINFYGFHSKKTGNYHLSFDDVRFINHSPEGNITTDTSVDDIEYPLMAKRDIKEGEEITQNYFEFDENHSL
jgi:uncharacterized protein